MPMNEIRQLILKNASTDQIRDAARRAGMRTLAEDGWRLVAAGRHDGRGSLERDDRQRSRRATNQRRTAASIAMSR